MERWVQCLHKIENEERVEESHRLSPRMTRSIRLLAPKEALRDDEIRVILRTMAAVKYELAVKDNQHVCDLFLFASHLFDVNFTRISLALDRNDETYAVSGGYQILDGYEPITQLVEPLKEACHILEVLIKDGDASVPIPLSTEE